MERPGPEPVRDVAVAQGSAEPASRLREVAAVFLKLGWIGFGGPAVHIALMKEEVVSRRG